MCVLCHGAAQCHAAVLPGGSHSLDHTAQLELIQRAGSERFGQDFSGVIWTVLYGRLLLCQREKKGESMGSISYLLGKV